jgi:hypothetical protein
MTKEVANEHKSHAIDPCPATASALSKQRFSFTSLLRHTELARGGPSHCHEHTPLRYRLGGMLLGSSGRRSSRK